MTEAQESADQGAIVQALLAARPAEQQRLLAWSRGLGKIRQGSKGAGEKASATIALTRELDAGWPLLKLIGRALGLVLWTRRSWRARLGVGSLLAVLFFADRSGAGLVKLGFGVSVPLWIIVVGVALALGAIVDAVLRRVASAKGSRV